MMYYKIIEQLEQSSYYVKETKENNAEIYDNNEIFYLEIKNNKIILNGHQTSKKEFDKIFFKNHVINKFIFLTFFLATLILFLMFNKIEVYVQSNFLIKNFVHYNFIHFIFNSICLFAFYLKLKKIKPLYIVIIGVLGLLFSTLFLIISGSNVYGSSGILYAYLPFIFINSRKKYILKLILIILIFNLPSIVIPLFSAIGHFGGYFGGMIFFGYLINKKNIYTTMLFK